MSARATGQDTAIEETSKDRGMQVHLLGGFAVLVDGRAVPESAWRLRRAKDVVKLLALAQRHRLHREQVMEALWPERSPEAAANNLHQALHVARRALRAAGGGPELLRLRDGVLDLCPEEDLVVDADIYLAAARAARVSGDLADCLVARALYRGELLPDDRYEEWTVARREALEQDHLSLVWDLAARQSEAADTAGAIETLRELVGLDPAHEAAHRELMRAYALDGRRRLALRQFQVLRTTLRRELDVEPAEESEALHEDILQGRLGDEPTSFGTPVAASATARPSSGRPSPHHNLPVALSSFVGRERETDDIGRLLDGTRLLTLTGPGGSGKTRLAIEAAWASREAFPDGVWLVQLAPLGHESLVVQAVAEVFDVREQAGSALLDSVIAHLAQRRLLVVLDNCEHLIDACAGVARDLLSSCPELSLMTTSREALRIAGEVVYRVPSLALPDPDATPRLDELPAVSSVQLFTERAQAISPRFELSADNAADVVRLCYHLDGLPLAIELAASRVASLPIAAIADRLGDRFRLLVGGDRTAIGRQQTLKATLDWSYRLLTEPEQMVLRRLAVFVGGIPLDAAEEICGFDDPRMPILDVIVALVDKSLVVPLEQGREPRFRLLETVREYGLEQLAAVGEQRSTEARHAAWCATLVGKVREAFPWPDRVSWLVRFEVEHDNIRAAFDRCLMSDPPLALRLAASLWPLWLWRAYLAEGLRRIASASARAPDPSPDLAEALLGAASLTVRTGDLKGVRGLCERAVELAVKIGAVTIACRELQVLGSVAWTEDDLRGAEDVFDESLRVATEIGFEAGQAAAMHGLGIVTWYAGDDARSADLFARSLAAFRDLSDSSELAPPMMDVGEFIVPQPSTGGQRLVFQETFGPLLDVPCRTAIGYVLSNEAMVARADGDLERARARMEESLDLFEEIGDDRAIGHALARLGNLATAQGALARARELLEQSFEIRRTVGDWRGMMMAQLGLGNLTLEEGDPDRAGELLHEAAERFRERGDRWGYLGALFDLANLAIAQGELETAKAWLEESVQFGGLSRRPRWIAWSRIQLAEVHRLEHDEAGARSSIDEALEVFERVGDMRGARHCRALLEGCPAGRTRAT